MNYKSTKRGASRKAKAHKPSKPHPDFPLYSHASGRWAEKVRKKMHLHRQVVVRMDKPLSNGGLRKRTISSLVESQEPNEKG